MDLPLNYIIEVIYSKCKRPHYNQRQNIYNFECCICNEGKSSGKKRRGFFLVNKNYICCQNCQCTWSPIEWLKIVTNSTYQEVLKEAQNYDDSLNEVLQRNNWKEEKKGNKYTLPFDCINLSDQNQINYYKENKIIKDVIEYINKRRLFSAVNKPQTYYISLTDKLHHNRLIIPFYNENNKIIFYQSRAIYEKDSDYARYLSKVDSNFSVFGINNISSTLDYIFLFEGPIDAMFVKNGLGIGGLSLSELQEKQLEKFRLYKRIWILDNQMDNKDVVRKYKELIDNGQRIFVMPDNFKEFKDLNELCVAYKLDQVSPKFFIDNSFTGIQAQLKLNLK